MIPEGNVLNNVERFSGFKHDYDRFRPKAPQMVVEMLTKYLGRRPSLVVDLGCGTGLSTFVWRGHADKIFGVEPNPDMRSKAQEKLNLVENTQSISFVEGYSNQLPLEDSSADLITCSQSFHWMEPQSTLREAARVLHSGGVFAAYDCDWPPAVSWKVEQRYLHLMAQVESLTEQVMKADQKAHKWDKQQHLQNMRDSRAFRFTKEVVFHNKEVCDAERYIGLALTQGGVQSLLKAGRTELDETIAEFKRHVDEHFNGDEQEIVFSYRMRLGIK